MSNASCRSLPHVAKPHGVRASAYRTSALRTTSSRKYRLQIHGRTHVNLAPAEQPAQFRLNIRKPEEADPFLRPELDEYIHIAGIREPVREDRSEQGQLADAIAPAQSQLISVSDGFEYLRDRSCSSIMAAHLRFRYSNVNYF